MKAKLCCDENLKHAAASSLLRPPRAVPYLFLLSGVLYVLCFPKWNLGWLAWVAFIPFLAASRWNSFRWAFLAGVIANIGTIYWVYPTCRWGGAPAWAAALAAAALCSYMAVYWGAFGVAARALGRWPAPARPFLWAAAWTALEFLRAHLLTGFPWLTLAMSQWQAPANLALAQVGGPWAVSFLIMLVNGAVALCLGRDRRAAAPAGAAALAGLAWGFWLFHRPPPTGPGLEVAVVQASIDQYKKWDAAYEKEIRDAYGALTLQAAAARPELIVWPETAVPGWVPNDPSVTGWLQDRAREGGTFLLAGAVTRGPEGDHNAAFLLGPDGSFLGDYRKRHLVPFGEYVPLKPLLSRLPVLNALGEFQSGGGPALLRAGRTALGVNICFEDLFPGEVRGLVREGAELLVNVTNDGWYRDTAAPEQHFAANVLRAVETGRWLVRAANTGVSGFIDPGGRIVSRGGLLERRLLAGRVQALSGETPYVRWGDCFAWACLLLLAGVWGRATATKRR